MKIVKKNNTYFINLKDTSESKLIDGFLNNELQINQINKDVLCFVLSSSLQHPQNIDTANVGHHEIKQKIIELLTDKKLPLSQKIEGKFEKLLNVDDLNIFKEMLASKEIVLFKLSDKYKKKIYKVNEDYEQKKQNSDLKVYAPQQVEVAIPNSNVVLQQDVVGKSESIDKVYYLFDKQNYIILDNSNIANIFSQKYVQEFKSGEIIGLKSFDNNYYMINSNLYNKIKPKILNYKQDPFSLEEISSKLQLSPDLIKIILEFLKEECLIVEKRKNLYSFV
ncbi:MAG TPA: hypothetical protein PLN85_03295 [archaeon]|nr:hypothetical protein [archaeon]HRT02520.1 hypothetical protein [Candidatus Diapherotrites archaeon]